MRRFGLHAAVLPWLLSRQIKKLYVILQKPVAVELSWGFL
jgi:hypothetical protein